MDLPLNDNNPSLLILLIIMLTASKRTQIAFEDYNYNEIYTYDIVFYIFFVIHNSNYEIILSASKLFPNILALKRVYLSR